MALQGQIPIEFGMVFPAGAYAAGGIEIVRDFERSSGDRVVQQADKHTGLPLWVVEVIDAQEDARQRTVKVKIAAQVQPVLPLNTSANGGQCDVLRPSTGHKAIQVAFADASVRAISDSISPSNWWVLLTPSLGDKPDSKFTSQVSP